MLMHIASISSKIVTEMEVCNPVFSLEPDFDELLKCVTSSNSTELETLLKLSQYSTKINFRDFRRSGRTLLHFASDPKTRDANILRILLNHNADPKLKDDQDQIPLHLAVSEGSGCFCKSCGDKAEECTNLLVKAWPLGVNSLDLTNKTPLHLAAENRFTNCAIIMLQNGANISLRSHDESGEHENLTTTLLKTIPEVFEVVLDQAIECDSGNRITGRTLRVDFGLFLGEPQLKGPEGTRRPRTYLSDEGIPRAEGTFLRQVAAIRNKSRDKILSHPVTELFMYEKERALKIVFLVPQALRVILAILYTLVSFIYYLHNCPFDPDNASESFESNISTDFYIPFTSYAFSIKARVLNDNSNLLPPEREHNCKPWKVVHILGLFVLIFTLIQMLILGWKLIFKPKHTLSSAKWWCWTLFVLCGLTTLSVPIMWDHGNHDLHSVFYPMAAIGTFLIWALLLVELGSIPSITVRIEMFNTVLKTVIVCSLSYGLLLLAFGFGLHLMFPKDELFASPLLSFVKVLTLMIGDTDYDGIFEKPNEEMPLIYSIPAHFFYATFLILVTIVFMNLLIGLAVSDIQKLKRTATITKTKGFIELLHLVELHLYGGNWDKLWLVKYLQEKISVVKRDEQGGIIWSVQTPAFEDAVDENMNSSSICWLLRKKSKQYPRQHNIPNKLRQKLLKKFKSVSACQ